MKRVTFAFKENAKQFATYWKKNGCEVMITPETWVNGKDEKKTKYVVEVIEKGEIK